MTDVKRYPFVDRAGLYAIDNDICTAEFVIDAADYDALEADKADDMRRLADDANKIHALTRRVEALEAGIAEWAAECADCMGRPPQIKAVCHSCAHIRELLTPITSKTSGNG